MNSPTKILIRRGTAATEFAICIPLVLLMALACADFGRISYFHQVVCNAARTGAESGATHKFTPFSRSVWEGSIEQAVLAEMQNIPDFNASEMIYELTANIDSDEMALIDVSVSYPFRTVVSWPGIPGQVMLRKNIQFRQYR